MTDAENKKHIISAIDLRNVLQNFTVKILNNLKSVKNMLKNMSVWISYPRKLKELLAEKWRDACDEECDKFFAGVNFIYSIFVEYLDKWMNVWKMSFFTWMTLSEPLNWHDIKPCIQFVINSGVCTDYVTCFDELKKN